MSRNAILEREWGNGLQRFRLGIAEIEELEGETDCGPYEILRRLALGSWRVKHIRHTLRLGLIGGGMKSVPALSLVARNIEPPSEQVDITMRILHAALFGPADDNVGKKPEAEQDADGSSLTGASPSLPSMEMEPSSDSRPRRLDA